MKFPLFYSLTAFLLCSWSLQADQIVMKNGDRVTGSIVKKDDKNLTIKTEFFGVVTLPWDKVDSVTADKPITVVLSGGETVKGSLAPAGEKVEVAAEGTKQVVAPSEIKALRNEAEQRTYERLLNPGLLELWKIDGQIGIAGTSGNAKTSTFTIPVHAIRVTRTDKTTAYFNFIRASAKINGISAATAQAVRGGWGYNRNLRPKFFVTTFNDYEYDRFQSLDLRVVLGGGLGYSVWKRENLMLDLVGGGAWDRESFDPGRPQEPFTRSSAEAYWGDDFKWKLSSRLSVVQGYRMFNNLTNTGQYRQNIDVGISSKLNSWLTWNISASDRYLSNPVPGRKKNDFLYSMGIGFTLAP